MRIKAGKTTKKRKQKLFDLAKGSFQKQSKSWRMVKQHVARMLAFSYSGRKDRKSERRLLLELEQAAQALEETIRTLGARARDGQEEMAASGFGARKGGLVAPVDADVALRFGRVVDPEFQTATFRSGIDFAAHAGTAVRSVGLGVVRFAGWFRGYGRIVIVDHGDGFHSISGHLDEIFVEVGDPVAEGQALGTVGETGSLGGPSLYFELRRNGAAIDPELWLMADG